MHLHLVILFAPLSMISQRIDLPRCLPLHSEGEKDAGKTFSRRLVWRDLAYWQMFHWPSMCSQPIRPAYADVEWGPPTASSSGDTEGSSRGEEEAVTRGGDEATMPASGWTAARTPSQAAMLCAWRRGRTGFPVVDAAMRQLWQTGWIHQNARMVGLAKDRQ